MAIETDFKRDPRHGLAPHEIGHAPGHRTFRLVLKAVPQHISDHQAEHPVTQKLEPLIMPLNRAAPGLAAHGRDRARMGQRLVQQGRSAESVADPQREVVVRRGVAANGHR